MKKEQQPISNVNWIDREKIIPNHYNPNKVFTPELKLLKLSITEDGWTQPIVLNPDYTIVDGFHRYTVSGDKDIQDLYGSAVPCVFVKLQDDNHKMISTIRHNRARGKHNVILMSTIVGDLYRQGLSVIDIQKRLQMDKEEVRRLLEVRGIKDAILDKGDEFSKGWTPV
jgi:ParB-like chromosome segregation protein Spo0J